MTTTVSAPSSRGTRLLARASAEALGTLFLVVIGLGVLIFINPQAVPMPASLASGLTVTAAMLAFGYLSGGHFNPAITVGHLVAGRMKLVDGAAYLGAQIVGALLGALAIFAVVRTVPGITDSRTVFDTATSGFGTHSSFQVPVTGVMLIEVLGAALLVGVFLGVTARRNPSKLAAPFAVGLTVAVLLQLGQSTGNLAFNPARATASAIFSSSWAVEQLWLFWVAPLVGAAIAGLIFRGFGETTPVAVAEVEEPLPADGWEEKSDDDAEAAVPESAAEVSTPAAESAVAPVEEKPDVDPARDFFDGKRG
ncbi:MULTISPECIES: MIP/aquaporin family protein [Arthrobacter]|uniref:Aquaporin Z n=1 Tax=Arthrobacter bambusae TaxID=1338426 RepID=A0AAW8DH23_9MICC|nr:aquaporin [Arthrobacter bambusae]MDP9904967.1 aquaporin Z [Arthrobacter bambusae]MDQ0129783.1 aquaporin Z [Arthrobacter bambusae]MDQ0181163.1 aquaporin Z [Arthrobacter bambusae]